MKALSSTMLDHIEGGSTRIGWAAKFTRTDGLVFRYVSGRRTITLDGDSYEGMPGFDISSITCTLGYSVDTLNLTVLSTDDLMRADFLAGRWWGCVVELSEYCWSIPAAGVIPWPKYRVANVVPIVGGFVLEMRDLRQLLLQDYTLATGKTCQNRLGDSRCGVSLSDYSFTFEVTSVTSRVQFADSALAQATDYFTMGELRFDTGLHAGLPLLVRQHNTGGVFYLAVPLIEDIVVGQTGTVVAGCLRRLEDCRDKFDNVLNMRAPGLHAPTSQQVAGGD